MNYLRNIVLMALRAEHPEVLDPDAQELNDFDDELFAEYDAEITTQAANHGIGDTPFNRSMLVFFANCSTAGTAQARVDDACTYFDAVQPVP